jgi:putative FmdB family regulatory protein
MPTYHYICEKCGHEFDYFQSMNDKPLRLCRRENCGQKKWGKGRVRREVGMGAGFLFKGAGFYATDYPSATYQKGAKEAAASSAAGDKAKPSAGGNDAAKPAKTDRPAPTKPAGEGAK